MEGGRSFFSDFKIDLARQVF